MRAENDPREAVRVRWLVGVWLWMSAGSTFGLTMLGAQAVLRPPITWPFAFVPLGFALESAFQALATYAYLRRRNEGERLFRDRGSSA